MKIKDDVVWQKMSKNLHKKTENCSCSNLSNRNSQKWKSRNGSSCYRGFLSRNLLVTLLFISLVNILSLISVVDSHQFSSFQSPRNIRHLPCVARKTGLKGTCMFAIDCLKSNGTHLGTCIDKFYFGSCCQLNAPEESNIYQHEISDNSIDNNVVSNFQHYSSPQRPLVPVSTIAAPAHGRRNVTASIQRVTTPSTTTKRKHSQHDVRVTTENIRLSTFQVVQESRVTTPTPVSSRTSTKPTSRTPVKTSSSTSTTSKTSITTKTTQKTTHKRPSSSSSTTTVRLTTTAPTTTRRNSTTAKPITEKWTTRRTPPPVIKVETSTFAPLNQKTTTTVTLPPKTTSHKTTVYKKPPIITGSTLIPVTMPYRNLTNRNPTKPTVANKTNAAYTDSKPIYINVTQTKAPRPKPKPTSEITVVPPTSLSHLLQETEFTTTQFVSSSYSTSTTTRPITTTVADLIRNSTSYVTNTSFRPTSRPMSSSTQQKTTQGTSSTAEKLTTTSVKTSTTTSTVRPPPAVSTTAKHSSTTGIESTKVTKPSSIWTTVTTSAFITTPKTTTTTRSTTRSTTKAPLTTQKVSQSTTTKVNATTSTTSRVTTPKPTYSMSSTSTLLTTTTKEKPSSSSRPTTEKPVLVTWTVPLADEQHQNETKEDLQTVNWVLVSSTPSVNQSTRPSTTTTSKKPTVVSTHSTTSTTTAPRTTQKTTQRTTTTTTTTTTKRPTTRSTTTTTRRTSTTTPSTTTTTTTTTSSTTKRPPPVIDDTGVPVLLIPEDESNAPSTSGPSSFSTEEIIGTSTSTSIEVKPPQSTESMFSSSNINLQNTSMSSTESSDIDYNNATSSTNTTDFFTSSTPAMPSLEGLDYRQICGKRMFPEPRIVGGAKASFGRWPWQISLRQWRTSTYLHKCGAALLNENWAITAAHCVDNVPPSDLLLRLGEYDLAVEEEPYGYQERRVQIVASHPQFDPRTFEYDLALLRFYEPVIFQPNIIPVCVPESDENFIGRTAYVTGWGRLYEDGPLPSVLQEVTVPVIKNDICEGMYRAAGYIEHIPHIFICAGWKKGGYDSCEGDSGGPMVIQRHDKRFLLAGVISWGIGCAEPNQPGVYTRISEFRDWINQILQF